MKNMLRSIGVVLVGFVTVAVLSILTDVILEAVGVFPPTTQPELFVSWMCAVALVYRSIYTIVGGYVTARLAKHSPMKHVVGLMVLGGMGGAAGLIASIGYPNEWYPILLAITGPFFVWLGGKMYMRDYVQR